MYWRPALTSRMPCLSSASFSSSGGSFKAFSTGPAFCFGLCCNRSMRRRGFSRTWLSWFQTHDYNLFGAPLWMVVLWLNFGLMIHPLLVLKKRHGPSSAFRWAGSSLIIRVKTRSPQPSDGVAIGFGGGSGMGNGRDGSALYRFALATGKQPGDDNGTPALRPSPRLRPYDLRLVGGAPNQQHIYVDALWGYELAFSASPICIWAASSDPTRLLVLQVLLVLWSVRLGTYLLSRCRGNRRMPLRLPSRILGKAANAGFFVSFRFKLLDRTFRPPFLILVQNPNPLGPHDYLGLAIWLIGFFGLSLADRQLARFKQSPGRTRSEVCESGLGNTQASELLLNGSSGSDTSPWDGMPKTASTSLPCLSYSTCF